MTRTELITTIDVMYDRLGWAVPVGWQDLPADDLWAMYDWAARDYSRLVAS